MVTRHEKFFNKIGINKEEDKRTMMSFIQELFSIVLNYKNKGEKVGSYD